MKLQAHSATASRQTSRWDLVRRFRGCTAGATAIEYSIVGALVAVTCIASVRSFGTSMDAMYAVISAAMSRTP